MICNYHRLDKLRPLVPNMSRRNRAILVLLLIHKNTLKETTFFIFEAEKRAIKVDILNITRGEQPKNIE